jgi:hypothetical protein
MLFKNIKMRRFYILLFFFICCTALAAQNTPQTCRIKRIEFSDSSFYHFHYDAQGRLSQYNYDSEPEKQHYLFQYFYNDKNRISHIISINKGTLMYVCNYIYANDTFTKRRVAFFERKFVRDEVFHYNTKGQIDRIDFQQSDGDSIVLRFEFNDRGYPIRRARLSNDVYKNSFADITWDTTRKALNPFETLFTNYPISNFFDREISTLPDYPIDFPISHYHSRIRDELGKQLNSTEWFFSNIKTNAHDFIEEMTLTSIINGKTQVYQQKCIYENCPK